MVGQAVVKIAVDLVAEGKITKDESMLIIDPSQLNAVLHPQFDQKAIENTEAQNIWANMRSKFLK